ncbi:sugar phosphate isomerase/epimerase family protein [Brachyspira catarrhinii]|uniref:Sugar phosphate isomerase/epimerase n=1 Tax=Brachyspira catarrhinii TaxID=2528966 RepID=A0ABY2TND4_9SPIR|nr:sugar phosphate isomerase/epimerase [Brachyspira catarrhinii]TKZ30178.1 sugar phosphate isomerase/epimerase [Brachyspira catarrhinii]
MNLCISSLAWNLEDRNKIYSFLNDKNIKYIEIVPNKISKLGLFDDYKNYVKLRKEWESFDIKAVSMQSLHFGLNNCSLFNSKEERENLFQYTVKSIEVANILDIKHLVFGSPKLRIIKDNMPYDDAINIAKDFFYNISKEAEKYNIVIGIEPNSKLYGTNFLTNTFDTYNFVKEINLSNIGINLDLSTIILENENLNNSIDIVNSLNKPFHSHISLPFLKNNYEDYADILEKYINKLKYSKANYCSIETVIDSNDCKYSIKIIENIICLIKNIIEKRSINI